MSLEINSDWLLLHQNKQRDQSFFEWYSDWTGSLNGASSILGLASSTAALVNQFAFSKVLQTFKEGVSAAFSCIGIIRIPTRTRKAVRSLSGLAEDSGSNTIRKVTHAIKNTLGAMGSWAAMILFFTASRPVKIFKKTAKLTVSIYDLWLSVSDYSDASQLKKSANGEVKEAAGYSRNFYFYNGLKNTLSVASNFLSTAALIWSPLVPVIYTVVLSFSKNWIAFGKDVYGVSGKYEIIPFDKPVIAGSG